jgi:segregation and condensation protein A
MSRIENRDEDKELKHPSPKSEEVAAEVGQAVEVAATAAALPAAEAAEAELDEVQSSAEEQAVKIVSVEEQAEPVVAELGAVTAEGEAEVGAQPAGVAAAEVAEAEAGVEEPSVGAGAAEEPGEPVEAEVSAPAVEAEVEVQNAEVEAEAVAAPSYEPVAESVIAEEASAGSSAAQAEETTAKTSSPSTTSLPVKPDLPSAPVAEPEPAPTADPAPMQEMARKAITLALPFAPEPTQEQKTAEKVAAALKARGQDAEQSPFSVIVSQVYDGPLDLLLDLIRKQDIDIYDIPIAKITAQFLAYVDQLKASDMDVAGEFIYTAALLIHIKSKMLLPRAPAGPEDAAEDPRRELVERLLEHERFKNAAQMLHEKQMLEAATWTNPGAREFREDERAKSETAPEIAADTVDLVRVFREILERVRNRPVIDVEEDTVTVGQMIQFLARRLTMEDKPVALRRLLSHTRSERALIAMFLALLELVRLQAILLRQDRHFSEIFIKKHAGFDAVMNQGLANARDDWR